MSRQTAWQATFDFWGQPIIVEPSKAQLSSDGGLLPLRQFDEQIGLTRQFAEALHDDRVPGLIDHTFLEMVRSRIYGVLAAYEEKSQAEIAAILRCSSKAVETRIYRARQQLREQLSKLLHAKMPFS